MVKGCIVTGSELLLRLDSPWLVNGSAPKLL